MTYFTSFSKKRMKERLGYLKDEIFRFELKLAELEMKADLIKRKEDSLSETILELRDFVYKQHLLLDKAVTNRS